MQDLKLLLTTVFNLLILVEGKLSFFGLDLLQKALLIFNKLLETPWWAARSRSHQSWPKCAHLHYFVLLQLVYFVR